MRIPTRLPTKYVIPLFIIVVVATAAGTVTLFTHTFPAVKTVPPPPVLTTLCTTLVNETAAPAQGTAGNITFDCGGGQPAWTFPGGTGTVTPTFTLGTGYTNLFFVRSSNSCNNRVFITYLISGSPLTLSGSSLDADYCAAYTSAPVGGFGSFTVTWTQ